MAQPSENIQDPLEPPFSSRALAHDLNNLLGAILGHAAYLQSLASPGDEVYESAVAIEKTAGRLIALTARLISNAMAERKSIDLHGCVRDVAGLLRPTTPDSIRIHVTLGAAQPSVLGDPAQLFQLVLNLVMNAREAMPAGGDLTIETSDHGEDRVLLAVRDTGRGIPAEMRELVFQPSVTTKPAGSGSGFGLAIVRRVVDQHGGSIEFESEPGRGTEFRVLLPRQ